MEHRPARPDVVASYREYAPPPELRDHVRALFWFGPAHGEARGTRQPIRQFHFSADDIFFSPVFADGHASLVFELGHRYAGGLGWHEPANASNATVMGPITCAAAAPSGEPPSMIGVYLRAQGCSDVLGVPASVLTDRIVSLSDIWARFAYDGLAAGEPASELESLRLVELELLRRLNASSPRHCGVRIMELASLVRYRGGRVSIAHLSELAGVSRQHLGRLFREHVGVSPKLYARLARFRAGLQHVAANAERQSWAQLSVHLGYADQSHLIAEFKEFSSLTPEQLSSGRRFHPFLGDTTDASPARTRPSSRSGTD